MTYLDLTDEVRDGLLKLSHRAEHEAGCGTETSPFSACTCGLSDAISVVAEALASHPTPDGELPCRRCGGRGFNFGTEADGMLQCEACNGTGKRQPEDERESTEEGHRLDQVTVTADRGKVEMTLNWVERQLDAMSGGEAEVYGPELVTYRNQLRDSLAATQSEQSHTEEGKR